MATDQQTRQDQKELDDLHALTGISPSEAQAMEDRAVTDDMAERNQLGGDGDEIPFRNDSKKRRFRVTKKQGVAGGLAGLAIGGVFGITSIIHGPLQIVQASKFFDTTFFSRGRNTQDISLRRIHNTLSGQSEKNKLGPLASKLTEKHLNTLRETGIESDFSTADDKGRRKLQAVHIDPTTDQGKKLLGRVMSEGVELPGIGEGGVDGRITIRADLRGREGGKLARSMVDQMINDTGKKGISAAIAKRRLKTIFRADFHPLSVARRTGEDFRDTVARRRSERGEKARGDTNSSDVLDPVGEPDESGNPTEVDPEIDGAANSADELLESTKGESRIGKIKAFRASNLFKAGAAATAVAAITCSVKDFGDNIPDYKMMNVIQPLIRLSIQTVSAGSQVMAMEDIDMTELASVAEAFYDEETGTSWAGSEAVKGASGETGGEGLDPAVKSQITGAYSGDKPGLFAAIDAIPGVDQVCGINNWFGDLPGIKQLSDATNSLVSGAASVVTGKGLEEWMAELVAVISGEAIDTMAEGAALGNLLSYGSLLASNASSIAFGAVEMTPIAVQEWKEYNYDTMLAERSEQSFSERIFDAESPNSLVGGIVFKLNNSPEFSSTSNLARSGIISVIPKTLSNISSLLVKPTSAQVVHGYDYGIPEYGIPLSTLESERYENVYDNIDRLENNDFAKLKEANDKWGKCFGNPLDAQGNIADKEAGGDYYAHLDSCKSDYGNAEFQDYQIYILDNVTIKSMACYEGIDDASCNEVGIGRATTSQVSSQPVNVGADQDTSNLSCPAGTTDGGVHQDYGPGRVPTVMIRICDVKGVTGVNASIAQSALDMLNAAEAAGHTLTGSAFRSYERQEQLRVTNGCTPGGGANACRVPTAPPGNSNHEVALAIDFNNMCFPNSTCPSSPAWVWLTQNAATHGFKPLSSEAWHWSKDGK